MELTELSAVDLSEPGKRNNASINCGRHFIEVDSGTGKKTRRKHMFVLALVSIAHMLP